MLEQKTIIYDDSCPMCRAYTAGFVKLGWLAARKGFSQADPSFLAKLDLQRARHEIPLYDPTSGKTLYGPDALYHILGARFPGLKALFHWAPFRAVIYQLYQVITFNRRIISGGRSATTGFDCAPDQNIFYQSLYIVLVMAATAGLSSSWLQHAASTATGALVLSQIGTGIYGLLRSANRLAFTGHWATVSMLMALVLVLFPFNEINVLFAAGAGIWQWKIRFHAFSAATKSSR
ncbi:MAG: hypothetical protein IPL65_04035 [Lewinellaceae bacterium]|nr:hypothetical protein [Lewinellaceae bacterium]